MAKPQTRAPAGADRRRSAFPIIDLEQFGRLAKSRKGRDVERMLSSPISEDWVTWTAFRLLQRCAAKTWWPDLVALARKENPRLALPSGWEQIPELLPWQSVASPRGYEAASRDRLRRSEVGAWQERSHGLRPVEGESEIDVTLRNRVLLVFAEAKLGSDISAGTTYDPERNQILRNIDCVIDRAEGRVPMFWMLVRDNCRERSYSQLMRHYRAHPDELAEKLPHHDRGAVAALAGNLALLRWQDVVARVVAASPDDDAEIASIKHELVSRCVPSSGDSP